MRSFFTRAVLAGAVAIAAVVSASAADISGDRSSAGGNIEYYSAYGARMEPVVIYDSQPGVIVRSYWYMPWANRHYFPSTGRRPRTGRLEHISVRRNSRSEDYFRIWGASSGFPFEAPPSRARQYGIPPMQYSE
ncbi:MAG TPA: hypothetical protein VIV34_11190 [Pseudolabrys sp.]